MSARPRPPILYPAVSASIPAAGLKAREAMGRMADAQAGWSEAPGARQADAGAVLPEPLLRAELSRLLPGLDFATGLEAPFRCDYEAQSLPVRRRLCVAAIGLIGITPLYDRALLHLPDAFNALAHRLQYGLMIPALLAAVAAASWPRLHRWSPPLTILALLCVCAGLLGQRWVAAAYGVHFPEDFVMAAVISALLLTGLRLNRLLPWALLITACASLVELGQARQRPDVIYTVICMWMLTGLAVAGAYYIETLRRSAWLQTRLLELQAQTDSLTGLANRRQFLAEAARLLAQAARAGKSVAVCMFDVDHFKAYNDHYGHAAGDECLRRIAGAIHGSTRRPLDLSVRWGGEEFAVLWFDVDPRSARQMAEAVRLAVVGLGIAHAGVGAGSTVTLSGGLWQGPPLAGDSVERLLALADVRLYAAKAAGRNRIEAG